MISLAEPALDGNELEYVTDCIRSGWVSSKGAYVKRFEETMPTWCGVRHGVATSSGTSAQHQIVSNHRVNRCSHPAYMIISPLCHGQRRLAVIL